MTKIIGLTGGIGSGKTTVAKLFEEMGVPVYIADLEAKKIMDSSDIITQIRKQFGEEVFKENNINRQKLAQVVFQNPEKLQDLNSIIHPLVKKHFEQWVKQKKDFPFIIKEAAILFESGSYKDCYKIITVTAPLSSRIERIINRDKIDLQLVKDRINNQWTDKMRISKSDFVIENTDIESTKYKVRDILKSLKTLE
jgi:dephospho-CoA kinase